MLSASLQAHDTLLTNRTSSSVDGGKFLLSGEDREYWSSCKRHYCFWASMLAMFGMLLAVAENEIRFNGTHENKENVSQALKGVVLGSTVLTVVMIYKYYESLIFLKRLNGVYLEDGVTMKSLKASGLWNQALLDIAVLLPQPYPGLDLNFTIYNKGLGRTSIHNIDSILLALMIVRLRFLPRFYGDCLSDLSSDAAAAFGRFNHVSLDAGFILKFVIANSLHMVTVLSVILVSVFAYLMMVFERPIDNSSLTDYANCVWLIVITMTTVGYGDQFPTTLLGRMVAVFASITAVIMLAIAVNLVVSKLTLSRAETKVLEVMDTIQMRKELKAKAALVVTRWAKAYLQYQHSDMKVRPGGYLLIPETRSQRKRNLDLRAAVYSSLPLLIAIEDFSQQANVMWQNNVPSDLPEMVAHVTSVLEQHETRIGHITDLSNQVRLLLAELQTLQEAKAGASS